MPLNAGLMSSNSHEWETPQGFFDILNAEFHFTLDAAASSVNAKCARYFTVADNALLCPWNGVVWCNPPYGRIIGKFVRRGWEMAQNGATVVMLIPARTDTRYWHEYVMKAAEIRFLRGRLYFTNNRRQSGGAPFPSAVIVFERGIFVPRVSSIEPAR